MILITDIDDVLADARWRYDTRENLNAYHAMSEHDKPNQLIVSVVNAMHKASHRTIAITGRPERFRRITNEWLVRNRVRIDELHMRPDKSFMSSPDLKQMMLSGFDKSITLILEDREDVTVALRGAGYNVLQVFIP